MKTAYSGFIGVSLWALTLAPPALGAGGEDVDLRPATTLDLVYDLYVGGIPLGKVAMSARFQGDDYRAISTLQTSGIVNRLWQSRIEASSSGLLNKGRVQPSLYDSFSLNRSQERRHATLTFDANGPKTLTADPPYGQTRYPVSDEQRKRTLDPLSAVIFLTGTSSAGQGKPCEVTAPIFDGRRRYDVSFSYARKTDVNMDNGLYNGPALVCQVQYKQIAGYQQSVIENNKRFPKIYAWVVETKSRTDPSRSFMVPIRVWAETEFGIVAAVASTVKLDAQTLSRAS